ncbi:MAG: hypothetical protein GXP47_01545 [Acidobacteria bacterium]|nr:hypothetical protein [Acidobacteriota bacterium]
MMERLARLEEELRELRSLVHGLVERLEHLEGRQAERPAVDSPAATAPDVEPPAGLLKPTGAGLRSVPSLLGRTLLVFAGAFLLRALTDAQLVSRPVGVALGLAYAGLWMFASYREDTKTAWLSSAIHGLAAVLIGFPLVWEATVRFQVWTPVAAAGILTILTAGGFTVAWRRELRPVAWVTSLGAALTSLALLLSTRTVEPFALLLIAIGLVSVWISYLKKWYGFRWVTAALADLVILQTSLLASAPGGPPGPYASLNLALAAALGVTLFLGYGGSFTARTLARRRSITPFEMIQMPVALVVGLGGAIRIAAAAHRGEALLGILTLLLGVACYGVAFTAVDRRLGRGRNFFLYSTLGVTLVLTGSLVLSAEHLLPFMWAGLAIATAVLGGRLDRATLRAHSAIYALAALAASGVLGNVRDAFTSALEAAWTPVTASGLIVLAMTGISYFVLAWSGDLEEQPPSARLPRLVLASLTLAGVLTVAVVTVRQLGFVESPAALAALRTVALAGAGLGTAILGRSSRIRELSWLTYPLLVLCGVGILAEDLRQGTALTLFAGFAAYGLALLIAPRLLKRHDGTAQDA